MAQEKEYFAFISYQRKDEEWADRLRSKLEHYRLPSSVRRQDASLPKEIRPIFRDALELAGGVLAKEIETALQQSKYLIVICSPNSAKSPWVNKEIQTFIDLGREDRIIPFIIDGTPFSDNEETECFPPALRSLKDERELLGININEMGRDAAAVKVVARMFGLKFDALWQRYEREKKRKRWIMVGGVFLFALVSLGIGGFIANQNTRLKESNWKMMENQSRAVAEKANSVLEEGDNALCLLLAQSILPQNMENPDRPYIPEAEYLLRTASQYENALLKGHTGIVYSASFSPDDSLILSAADSSIYVWNLAGQCVLQLKRHYGRVFDAKFSSDGRYIVSASRDDTVRVWNRNGDCVKLLAGHDDYIYSLCFSPEGKFMVTLSANNGIKIWDTSSWLCKDSLSGSYNGMTFDSVGKLYAVGDAGISIWDINKSTCIDRIIYGQGKEGIAISPNDEYMATWEDDLISVWNLKTKELVSKIDGYSTTTSLVFSPDSRFVVSSAFDNTIKSWNALTGEIVSLDEIKTSIGSKYLVYSHDGKKMLSASSDNVIKVRDLTDNNFLRLTIPINIETRKNLFYSSDGKELMLAAKDSFICVWSAESGMALRSIQGDASIRRSVSNDGSKILRFWDSNTCLILDANSNEILMKLEGHSDRLTSASFSNDGNFVVTSSLDRTVRTWDAASGKCIHIFDYNGEGVVFPFASFSHDNNYLAVVVGRHLYINDLKSGNRIARYEINEKGKRDMLLSVAFRPDGKELATASLSTIKIWRFPSLPQLNEEIKARLNGRQLTPEERRQYYLK